MGACVEAASLEIVNDAGDDGRRGEGSDSNGAHSFVVGDWKENVCDRRHECVLVVKV